MKRTTLLILFLLLVSPSFAEEKEFSEEWTVEVPAIKYGAGNATNYELKTKYYQFTIAEIDDAKGYSIWNEEIHIDKGNNGFTIHLLDYHYYDLNRDGKFDAKSHTHSDSKASFIWFKDKWIKVNGSKDGFKFKRAVNKKYEYKFKSNKWVITKEL